MQPSNSAWVLSADAVNQLVEWVRQAGQIALGYFNKVTPRYKPDQTFLTQADLDIEGFLAGRIRSAFPEYDLIAEERTRNESSRPAPGLWALDPLDGTTAFVQGLPGWGISLGLLYQGHPCFGLFYMPLLNDLTCTTGPDSVHNNGRNLHQAIRQDWGQKDFLAVNASAHCEFQINVRHTKAMGSVGANLAYTARGAAAAAFIPKARLWDLVAGAAILTRAGGTLRYLSGRDIDYLGLLDGQLAPEPIIAGHPRLLTDLQHLIRPRPTKKAPSGQVSIPASITTSLSL